MTPTPKGEPRISDERLKELIEIAAVVYDKDMDSALRELAATRREGWVLVPRECDDPMAKACRRQIGIEFGANGDGTLGYYKRIVNAALSSAPKGTEGTP